MWCQRRSKSQGRTTMLSERPPCWVSCDNPKVYEPTIVPTCTEPLPLCLQNQRTKFGAEQTSINNHNHRLLLFFRRLKTPDARRNPIHAKENAERLKSSLKHVRELPKTRAPNIDPRQQNSLFTDPKTGPPLFQTPMWTRGPTWNKLGLYNMPFPDEAREPSRMNSRLDGA